MRKQNPLGRHRPSQTFLQKVQRRHPVARLLLAVILAFTTVGALPAPTQAAGPYTHELAVMQAIDKIAPTHRELTALLRENQSAVLSGAKFADWAIVFSEDLAERVANDQYPGFEQRYLAYLQRTLTWPWDAGEKHSVAFLFGLISHQVVDELFHKVYQQRAEAGGDPDEPGTDHNIIEEGVDAFHVPEIVARRPKLINTDNPTFNYVANFLYEHFTRDRRTAQSIGEWDYPPMQIKAILAAYGDLNLQQWMLDSGLAAYARIVTVQKGLAENPILWGSAQLALPYSRVHYDECGNGGMCDQVNATVAAWREIWNELTPVTAITVAPSLAVDAAASEQLNSVFSGLPFLIPLPASFVDFWLTWMAPPRQGSPVTVHLYPPTLPAGSFKTLYALNHGAATGIYRTVYGGGTGGYSRRRVFDRCASTLRSYSTYRHEYCAAIHPEPCSAARPCPRRQIISAYG